MRNWIGLILVLFGLQASLGMAAIPTPSQKIRSWTQDKSTHVALTLVNDYSIFKNQFQEKAPFLIESIGIVKDIILLKTSKLKTTEIKKTHQTKLRTYEILVNLTDQKIMRESVFVLKEYTKTCKELKKSKKPEPGDLKKEPEEKCKNSVQYSLKGPIFTHRDTWAHLSPTVMNGAFEIGYLIEETKPNETKLDISLTFHRENYDNYFKSLVKVEKLKRVPQKWRLKKAFIKWAKEEINTFSKSTWQAPLKLPTPVENPVKNAQRKELQKNFF